MPLNPVRPVVTGIQGSLPSLGEKVDKPDEKDGDQGDPRENRTDRKGVGQSARHGCHRPAEAEGEPHHEARHHRPALGREFLPHGHPEGERRHDEETGQENHQVKPEPRREEDRNQGRRGKQVGCAEDLLETDTV